jgi:hypothetical protein
LVHQRSPAKFVPPRISPTSSRHVSKTESVAAAPNGQQQQQPSARRKRTEIAPDRTDEAGPPVKKEKTEKQPVTATEAQAYISRVRNYIIPLLLFLIIHSCGWVAGQGQLEPGGVQGLSDHPA